MVLFLCEHEYIGRFSNLHQCTFKWFYENKMIENPDKFQAIVIDKRKSNNTDVKFFIDQEEIQAASSAAILDITIDDKLKFN